MPHERRKNQPPFFPRTRDSRLKQAYNEDMASQLSGELLTDFAHDLVADVAPGELPLFRVTSEAYLKDPEKTLRGQPAKDQMLGFGMGEAVIFLTPSVLAIGQAVLQWLGTEVTAALKKQGSEAIDSEVKSLFKKFRPGSSQGADSLPGLTRAQLAQLREVVLSKAGEAHIPVAKADLLADAVVAKFALAG